ncbi:small GTP-binding protein Sar1 [Gracilaria domingensis]|nr:small GTP-binding protein Sar1 [Gracilaria domingensis]
MTQHEWKTVRRRGKRRRLKGEKRASPAMYHVSAPLAPDGSTPQINADHVNDLAESLKKTDWWQQTAAHVVQAAAKHAGSQTMLYCLGMGSFAPWNNGSHQLACACLLRELLQAGQCVVGDPCMNEADELVVRQLNMSRREWQPSAGLEVQQHTLLFMFLPHCTREGGVSGKPVFNVLRDGGAAKRGARRADEAAVREWQTGGKSMPVRETVKLRNGVQRLVRDAVKSEKGKKGVTGVLLCAFTRRVRTETSTKGIVQETAATRKMSLNVVAQPPEALGVAHFPDDGAHEELDGADVAHGRGGLSRGEVVQAERRSQLLVAGGARHVDLVAQDEERDVGQHLIADEPVQLVLDLREALPVDGVHQEHDAVHLCVVVAPNLARGGVAAQVEGAEADVADHDLLGGGLLRGDVLRDAIVAQHVHERGLARVVQPQEEDLGVLVVQPQVGERVPEPRKHDDGGRGGGGGPCDGRRGDGATGDGRRATGRGWARGRERGRGGDAPRVD